MNNYKLKIQYDGTDYCGWQIQQNGRSIQQEITNAIKILLKKDVNLIGSGRTDSGVHALGQTANFRFEDELDLFRFKYSLNSLLPQDISVIEMSKTDENFHSRFDAKKRTYLYLFSSIKSPFYNRYSAFLPEKINCDYLNKITQAFIGEHDFSSFCKTKSDTENKICNVYSAHWKMTKTLTFFFIEADRFLHGMVRAIIGTLLFAEKNNLDKNYIKNILDEKNRQAASEAVPAKGLFLYKVKY